MLNLQISIRRLLSSGIFKRTLVYTFSGSFNALIAFLLLPVLTKYLSPYDYGVVETFGAVTACLTGVVIIGGNTLLSKQYFKLGGPEREEYVGNILGMILSGSLLLFVFFLLFSFFTDFFSNLIKISNALILLAIAVSFSNAIIALVLTLFQIEKKTINYAVLANLRTVADIAVSLFLIVVVGLKWQGRITGIACGSLLFLGVALLVFQSNNIKVAFPRRYGKEILLLGVPLIIAHMTGWVNEMIDKLMISNLIGVESTGIYSVGYRFGMVIMMVGTAFSRAWLPFFFENIKEHKHAADLKIVKATYIYIVGLVVVSLCFGLLGKHLLYFMVDKEFYAAGQFIFLVAMAYCFDGIWKMFTGYLIYREKTKIYSFIVLFSAIVNVVLNYILLQKIGLIGAAWATFVSFGVGAILTVYAGARVHPMPWRLGFLKTIS